MNILICDDHPIVCSGVEEVLNAIFDNLNIVKAFDIDSAITYLNTEEYDYLFLDLHFQERNVTEILNIIQFPQKVYIFTSTDNYQLLKTVLNYDVLGIIHKSTDLALLPSILKSKDTPYLDPLFQSIMEKNKHFDLLTNKELEILRFNFFFLLKVRS